MALPLEAYFNFFMEKIQEDSKKKKKAKKSKSDKTVTQDDAAHQRNNLKFKEPKEKSKERKKRKKRVLLGIDDSFTQACAASSPPARWASPEQESHTTAKQNDDVPRKNKFKRAMEKKKEKKRKKKWKKRVQFGIDDVQSPGRKPAATPVSNEQIPLQTEEHQVAGEATRKKRKKSKSTKKVSFELTPGYDCVRNTFTLEAIEAISPITQSSPAKDLIPLQKQGVGDHETPPQATEMEGRSAQVQDSDSQRTGEDPYSQDLFITQKTFRPPSSSEPSSAENNDGEEVAAQQDAESCKNVPPRRKQGANFTRQAEERNIPPTQHQDESHLHDPQGEACIKQTQSLQQPRNPYMSEPMEILSKGPHSPWLEPKKANSNQRELMALSTCGTEESKESHAAHLKHKEVKTLSDITKQPEESPVRGLKATRPTSSPHTSKQPKKSPARGLKATRPTSSPHTSKQPTSEPTLLPLRITTSTQTENYFNIELSSYLRFHQQSRAAVSSVDLEPLDLSLACRTRAELGRTLSHSAKSSVGRGETTPSLQSEAETKSTDTTSSSEDTELSMRSGRLDLVQVRAVQTRLNESFFFKMKREGPSPRPESPLMKLAQGRQTISRKRH